MYDYNLCAVLSNAAHVNPKHNESASSFTKRLLVALAADDFPSDDWETLPDDAQQWVNEQIRAKNERKEIEEVPGYEEHHDATALAPKPKANGAERGSRTKHPSGVSAVARMKELLLADMQLTPNQLHQKLESEDYTCSQSTVISVKADFKATLKFLQDKGLLAQNLV